MASQLDPNAVPAAAKRTAGPPGPSLKRWLYVWIAVSVLVVLVVIGFLVGIAGALDDINDGLKEADAAVTSVGGNVQPLPVYIQRINGNLTQVNNAVKPLSGQATTIVDNLGRIDSTLKTVSGSLGNTSGSLVDTEGSLTNTNGVLGTINGSLTNTSGSLVNTEGSLRNTNGVLGNNNIEGSLSSTSGMLVRVADTLAAKDHGRASAAAHGSQGGAGLGVLGLARRIRGTLHQAQIRKSLGSNGIWRRVRFANGGFFLNQPAPPGAPDPQLYGHKNPNGLNHALSDANNILGGLKQVNKHLNSVCRALPPFGTGTC